MKRFHKLLCAVAAIGLVGCTTDVTEDAAVVVPSEGSVKTLTVALDGQTRIELGEKTAEGKYPVYWQEGDVLRVNDGKTTAIAIHDDKSVADFTFAVADADAYGVVYPYVEGLTAATEGCLPVKFAEVQNYTEGSFEAASFPMYAYAAAAELAGVKLNYLAGVLAFELTGAGEVLTKVELTVTEGAIAGTFDVNCQTGEMTAQTGAAKKLTYQLPADGLTLSDSATMLYVAVPAGDYGSMKAKFCTTDDEVAMIAGVPCTGEKALKAGVVREFKNIIFKDNSSNAQSDMFEIYDETSLLEFAEMCKAGTFDYKGAEVTRSFAVTLEGWEPIEGFSGILEGNDNTIRELTKPLFGTTNGTIQNLNIRSAYEVTTDYVFGAFAAKLTATADKQGALKNCKLVEGSTVNYNNADPEEKAAKDVDLFFVGGLVGICENAVVENCKSYATLTVTKTATKTVNYNGAASCMVGQLINAVEGVEFSGLVTGCENLGLIDWVDTNGSRSAGVGAYIGGVVGCCHGKVKVYNCTNRGNINLGGGHYDPSAGCVVGRLFDGADVEKLYNYGDFVHTAASVGYSYTGCVVGAVQVCADSPSTITDCHNYGSYTVDAEAKIYRGHIGGVTGYPNDVCLIKNCSNSGAINMYGVKDSGNADFHIGGIVGLGKVSLKGCSNSGAITVKGNKSNGNDFHIGGVVGETSGAITDCENSGKVTVEDWVMEGYLASGATSTSGTFRVAGIAAQATGIISGTKNLASGEIIVKNVTCTGLNGNTTFCVAGGFGYASNSISDTHNYAKVTLVMTGTNQARGWNGNAEGNRTVQVAGLVGYHGQTGTSYSLSNISNEGELDITCEVQSTLRCGGLIGYNKCPSDGVTNKGNITLRRAKGAFYLGGVYGYQQNNAQKNLTNEGNISVSSTKTDSGEENQYDICYIGGVVGNIERGLDTATNKGTLTISGRCADDISAGAIVGYVNSTTASAFANLTNEATGVVTYTARTVNTLRLSGSLAYITASKDSNDKYYSVTQTNAWNKANITVDVHPDTLAHNGGMWIGGISGRVAYGGEQKNCTNDGKISVTGSANQMRIGGLFAEAQVATNYLTNNGDVEWLAGNAYTGSATIGGVCGANGTTSGNNTLVNTGNVTCNGTSTGTYVAVGGVSGYATLSYVNPSNSGAVTIGADCCAAGQLYVAGVVGCMNAGNSRNITGGSNSGVVLVEGSSDTEIFLGGILGYAAGRNDKATCDARASVNSNRLIYRGVSPVLYIGSIAGGIDGSAKADAPNEALATYSIIGDVSSTTVHECNDGKADNDFFGYCEDAAFVRF